MTKFEELQSKLINQKNISPKMLDIVTALKCLDIKVVNSYEGCLDNTLDPNITYDVDLLIAERDYSRSTTFYPFVEIKLEETKKEAILNLVDLVDEFYSTRNTTMSKVITMTPSLMRKTIIKPHSGDVDSLKTDPKEKQKLYKAYHKEFNDFTEFLKSKINK